MPLRKLAIIDIEGDVTAPRAKIPKKEEVEKLSEDFGRNLDTIAKARQWLTNPHNWHKSDMYVIKWDGLLTTINRRHAIEMLNSVNDNFLVEVVIREQMRLKRGGKKYDDEIVKEKF